MSLLISATDIASAARMSSLISAAGSLVSAGLRLRNSERSPSTIVVAVWELAMAPELSIVHFRNVHRSLRRSQQRRK